MDDAVTPIAVVLWLIIVAWSLLLMRRAGNTHQETLDERVDLLTNALSDSTRIVGDIEREIRTRREAVERLRQEQQLLELDREQVEAVAQKIRGELRREGRRAFWLNVAVGAFFFGLGIIATLLLS